MPLSDLNKEEVEIIGQCITACVYGPFFGDTEFLALFRVSRSEAKVVADQFPNVDELDDSAEGNDDSWLVINNVLANVVACFEGNELPWGKFISVTPHRVKEVYEKWR